MVLLSKSVHFGDILLEQYEVLKCMINRGISRMVLASDQQMRVVQI